ncbi:hypothetical protein CC78DRAFT_582385 [Lojkania enalia]|uniref:Uncharacterized protein n=1 Tax=Lojkania enalia TaxID=147567 RepID=A0A9P4N4Z3_9PLEO|nr:hypothetical protein CC78DRAFT_582385 [Didymosphaeria enalia]
MLLLSRCFRLGQCAQFGLVSSIEGNGSMALSKHPLSPTSPPTFVYRLPCVALAQRARAWAIHAVVGAQLWCSPVLASARLPAATPARPFPGPTTLHPSPSSAIPL